MFEFLTVLMATLVVFYVASPLMQRQRKAQQISSEADLKLSSTLHQQGVLQNTIDDLEFDYQTGKLSTTDYESMVAEHRKSLRQIDERLKKLGGVRSADSDREIKHTRKKQSHGQAVCPQCQSPVQSGDKFCSKCGAPQ